MAYFEASCAAALLDDAAKALPACIRRLARLAEELALLPRLRRLPWLPASLSAPSFTGSDRSADGGRSADFNNRPPPEWPAAAAAVASAARSADSPNPP